MFDAGDAWVLFYSRETGDSYEVGCCTYMSRVDCGAVCMLASSNIPYARVYSVVAAFQEVHNRFDYGSDIIDAERADGLMAAFRCLSDIGISAYVDGLSWG